MATSRCVFVLALVFAVQRGSVYGLRCLECTDIQQLESCDSIAECANGDVCFIQQHITRGGLLQFSTGCMPSRRCLTHKRSLTELLGLRKSRDTALLTCVECCDEDFCNIQGCGQTAKKQPSRGPLCFECSYQGGPDKCRNIVGCDFNEKCLLRKSHVYDQFWTTGCSPERQCHMLHSNITTDHCVTCCQDDFCNDHCQGGGGNNPTTRRSQTSAGAGSTTMRPVSTVRPLTRSSTHAAKSTTHDIATTVQNAARPHMRSTTHAPTSSTQWNATAVKNTGDPHLMSTTHVPNTTAQGKTATSQNTVHPQLQSSTQEPNSTTHGTASTAKNTGDTQLLSTPQVPNTTTQGKATTLQNTVNPHMQSTTQESNSTTHGEASTTKNTGDPQLLSTTQVPNTTTQSKTTTYQNTVQPHMRSSTQDRNSTTHGKTSTVNNTGGPHLLSTTQVPNTTTQGAGSTTIRPVSTVRPLTRSSTHAAKSTKQDIATTVQNTARPHMRSTKQAPTSSTQWKATTVKNTGDPYLMSTTHVPNNTAQAKTATCQNTVHPHMQSSTQESNSTTHGEASTAKNTGDPQLLSTTQVPNTTTQSKSTTYQNTVQPHMRSSTQDRNSTTHAVKNTGGPHLLSTTQVPNTTTQSKTTTYQNTVQPHMRSSTQDRNSTTHAVKNTGGPHLLSTTQVPNTTTQVCTNKQVDLIFLLDDSKHCPSDAWTSQLQFVVDFVNKVTVGSGGARVAMVTYSTNATDFIPLDNSLTKSQLTAKIMQAPYIGQYANLYTGLNAISRHILDLRHGILSRNTYVITLTNRPSGHVNYTLLAANRLKARHMIRMYAIGLGHWHDRTELKAIASESHFMYVPMSTTDKQWSHETIDLITSSICDDSPCKRKTMDICFVLDSSGNQTREEFHKQLLFITMIIRNLDLEGHGHEHRVCVVVFATDAETPLKLDQSTHDSITAVLNIQYRTGETRTDLGLNAAKHGLHVHAHDTTGERKIIVLAHEHSTYPDRTSDVIQNLQTYGLYALYRALQKFSWTKRGFRRPYGSRPTQTVWI